MVHDEPPSARKLFEAALDLPEADRASFLRAACGEDVGLREEVGALLAHDLLVGGVFLGDGDRLAGEDDRRGLPRDLGRYSLLRVIGEGGMGVVYEARQEAPRRSVAIKVLRPGVDVRGFAGRLQREAEALARLQHPGVAQVFEAGTALDDLGRVVAYFAMELVRGEPLDEFASRRGLDRRARLELVAQVAEAVQHAHERGVVHRDLKPANILVGADGLAKVLDFSIARLTDHDITRATTDRSGATCAGQILGTLPYMSPEQVAGDPSSIDARCDVYALGVILYELLAGRPPVDVRDCPLMEAMRRIREDEPSRLGALDTLLRGDADTIVAKALEKSPERRYAGAGELAADIRRHLRHEPIVARPPSRVYRLRKFARRNRALVVGMAATFLSLLGGLLATAFFAIQASRQRDAATRLAYQAKMSASLVAFLDDDHAAAERHLREAPEALRGWEWHHIHAGLDRSLRRLDHDGDLAAVGALSCGSLVWTRSRTGTLSVIDAADGRILGSMQVGDRDACRYVSVDLAADGLIAAIIDTNGQVSIRSFPDGAVVRSLRMDAPVAIVALGAQGTRLLSTEVGRAVAHLHDLKGDTPLWTFASPDPRVEAFRVATFVGDSSRVLLTALPQHFLVDLSTGELAGSYLGWSSEVQSWRQSLCALRNEAFEVRSLVDGGLLHTVPVESEAVDGVQVAARGAAFIATRGGPIRCVDLASGATLAMLLGHAQSCAPMATADGRFVISIDRRGEARVWDAWTSAWPTAVSGDVDGYSATAVSPDSSSLVAVGWGHVVVWDLATCRPRWARSISADVLTAVAWRRGGRQIVVGDASGFLHVLDGTTGAAVRKVVAPEPAISAVEILPDDSVILAAGTHGVIHRHAIDEGDPAAPSAVFEEIGRAGRLVREIKVFERGGSFAAICPGGGPSAASAPSSLIVGSSTRPGRCGVYSLPKDARSIAVMPDDSHLAIDNGQGGIVIADRTGAPRRRLASAGSAVRRISASPDGTRLAAATDDGQIVVWDPLSGDLLYSTRHALVWDGLAFIEGGRSIIAIGRQGELLLLETATPACGHRERDLAIRGHALAERLLLRNLRSPQLALADLEINGEAETLSQQVRAAARDELARRGPNARWIASDIVQRLQEEQGSRHVAEEMVSAAEAAVEAVPGVPNFVFLLGAAQLHAGRHEEALASLERSLALAATGGAARQARFAIVSGYLAVCRDALGDRAGAVREAQRFREGLAGGLIPRADAYPWLMQRMREAGLDGD